MANLTVLAWKLLNQKGWEGEKLSNTFFEGVIRYWFTIRQAMKKMEQGEFVIGGRKSLPRVALVFNEAYDLLGMVRRRDNLRGLERIHDKSHAGGDEELCPLITPVFKGLKVSSEVKQIHEISKGL